MKMNTDSVFIFSIQTEHNHPFAQEHHHGQTVEPS